MNLTFSSRLVFKTGHFLGGHKTGTLLNTQISAQPPHRPARVPAQPREAVIPGPVCPAERIETLSPPTTNSAKNGPLETLPASQPTG